MTVQEKAFEIFNKCCDYAHYTDEDGCFTERETMYKNGRALALIMVEEIIKDRERLSDALFYDSNYWVDVKKELENIEICDNTLLRFPNRHTVKNLEEDYMKAKHEAERLINRFADETDYTGYGVMCALIAVKEIINELEFINNYEDKDRIEYWNEVINEINK